jgi:hypothetical protein
LKKERITAHETNEDGKHEERGEELGEQVVRLEAAAPVAAAVAATMYTTRLITGRKKKHWQNIICFETPMSTRS